MILNKRGVKLEKRGIVWIFLGIFLVVLIGLSAAQTSTQQGCFTQPSYVTANGCGDISYGTALSQCNNDQACMQEYFNSGAACTSLDICTSNPGWCTDDCSKGQINYPAQCADRNSFVAGAARPAVCAQGCCICTDGTNNVCSANQVLWSTETQASCSQKCAALSGNYAVGHFNTTANSTECSQMCNVAQFVLANVTGTVFQSQIGGPFIPGAKIEAAGKTTLTSGGNGNYNFTNLPTGPITFVTSELGFITNRTTKILTSGPNVLDIALQPSTDGFVRGKVQDSNGQNISGALVAASGPEYVQDYSNATGDFLLENLQTGQYSFTVSKPGYSTATQTIQVQQGVQAQNFIINLVSQGWINGSVTTQQNAPISGATIYVDGFPAGQTDSNGKYYIAVFANATGVNHSVYARKPGYAQSRTEDITIQRNQVIDIRAFTMASTVSACTSPKQPMVQNFAAHHVLGKKEIRLTWDGFNCNELAGFYINKTVSSGPFQGSQSFLTFLSVVGSNMPLSFVDTNVSWGTQYTYRIWAVFDDAPTRFSSQPATTALTMGDAICEGKFAGSTRKEFCFPVSGQLRRRCNNQNKMETVADCSNQGSNYYCWGPNPNTWLTSCKPAACSAPVWWQTLTRQQCYGAANPPFPNYCYWDQTQSTGASCQSCTQVDSCWNYSSQDACTTNNCIGERSCNWATSQLAGGWCTEPNYQGTDHCRDCTVFCTQSICSDLGDCFVQSYQTTSGTQQKCTACSSQSRCADFTTQTECEGGQTRQFMAAGQIIPSDDVCGMGTCKWDNSKTVPCFKDGDIDGNDECNNPSKVPSSKKTACQKDNLAPVTSTVPQGYIGVGGGQATVTFQATDNSGLSKVQFCISDQNNCIPYINATYQGSSVTVNLANQAVLQNLASGDYYLRYRSIDEFYNVEAVKSRGIYIDLMGPQILPIQYTVNEQTNNQGQGNSAISFRIATTENANCSDKLVEVQSNTVRSALPNNVNDSWTISYQGLPDGLYDYYVTCTDNLGNADSANVTGIVIDAVKSIQVILPPRATDQNQINFRVRTLTGTGTCDLYNGSVKQETMTALPTTQPPQDHNSQGNYIFSADGYYDTWRVECFTPNQDNAVIPFTIDHTGPRTYVDLSAEGSSRTGLSGNFSAIMPGDTSVRFRCQDQPPHGFGCQATPTKFCLTSLGSTCTPGTVSDTASISESKTVCYHSTDLRNNTESVHCGEIRLKRGAGVEVIQPSNGVSAVQNFDLIISTQATTDICKFGFNSLINFSSLSLTTNGFAPMGDNIRHNITGFTQHPSITGFPSGNTDSLDLYVVCNLTNGEITETEKVTVGYDSTRPQISLRMSQASPIAQPGTVDLIASSDDETICKYSRTQTDYNSMQGQFPGYTAPIFRTENRQPITVSQGQFTYKVACENKAELISQTASITYTVDYSASGIIVSTAPSGSTQNQSVTLGVQTNKAATCGYTYNSAPSNFVNTGGLSHSSPLANLAEGIYKIPVSCSFAAVQGRTDSSTIEFKVDRTAPRTTRVNDGVYSCGLDRASAMVEAKDNLSSVTEFEYILLEDWSDNQVVNRTSTSASIQIDGLELNKSQDYYFKVRSKDAAGNWETSYTNGDGFTATLANKTECRDKRPPSITFSRNVTAEGIRVSIGCDDDVGCAELYYGTAVEEEDCSPDSTYQDIPVLVTSTSYLCAEAVDIVDNRANKTERIAVGDEDGDGVTDGNDFCQGTRPGAQVDSRGCSDRQLAIDTDHDRLPDWWEIQYEDLECALSFQEEDSDFDGVTDDLEDYDGDGLINFDEFQGNEDPCAITDTDGDGIIDSLDNCDNTPASEIDLVVEDENSSDYGCGPSERFSLGDGIDDGWRLQYFGCIECTEAAAGADPDEDGLTNLEEYDLANTYARSTNPTRADTDGDSYEDGEEVEKGWNPLDAESPMREKSVVLPIILLILGLLMVIAGVTYLSIKALTGPKSAIRPSVRPGPRGPAAAPRPAAPRPVPRAVVPGRREELIRERKERLEKERERKRRGIFGIFGGKPEPLPKMTGILRKKDKSVFDRLAGATKHYMVNKEKVAPKLSGEERDVFEQLAKKVKKPTKTALKKHLRTRPKEEVHDIFNKLVEIAGRHSGKDLEHLKKPKEEEEK